MPSPELEAAEALLAIAADDEAVVRELLDSSKVGDSVIGFHAQQAVEKLLKAVLASRGIDYPFTHDLEALVDQLGREALPASLPVADAEGLTPWATNFRYAEPGEVHLDRRASLAVVEAFRAWAESEVRGGA